MGARRLYRPAGVVLARVTTDPGNLPLPDDPRFLDDADVRDGCGRQWLAGVWGNPQVREALKLASPALAQRIDGVLADGDSDTGTTSSVRFRRLILAVLSYLLRWQQRPTPFGLFAGVAVAQTGREVMARFGTSHRISRRADGQWLNAFIDRIERHPELLPRLQVITNNVGFVRGDRFVISGKPHAGPEPGPLVEFSVRYTRPVRVALGLAKRPIRFDELVEHLGTEFPTASRTTIRALLAELVQQGILLTNLRTPTTVVDTLDHLVVQLRAAGANRLPDLAPMLADLTEIHQELSRRSTFTAPSSAITSRMKALCAGTEHRIAVDTAVDSEITVPIAVLDEAAAAASALLRLTAHPFGTDAWKDYHVRFRHRYGPGALVPVQELVADSGLGLPAGFLGASRGRAARAMTDRDATLMAFIQEASVDGCQEVEITEQMIRALVVGDFDEAIAPARVELAFEVHADSCDALRRGRFQLWVTGVPRSQSSMTGRFAHLLPDATREQLAASYATTVPDESTVVAQLSFPPRRTHNDNVVRIPQLLPAAISLAEYPDSLSSQLLIELDDLAVTADSTQMYLVQISTGRRVHPQVLHALEASVQTPPLARFIAEVTSARNAVFGPFDFGVARTLPHLPRIRYGRTVLSPARWILSTADLSTDSEPVRTWEKTMNAWRDRWHVPRHITLVQGELRLRLDLEDSLHRAIVRARLDRAGQLELREAPDPADHGWVGRACEFLMPFTTTPRSKPSPITGWSHHGVQAALPGGGEVLHAQLLGHPARYDEILTEDLPRFLASLCPVRWWFRRHRDTTRPDSDQQVWLYLRLPCCDDYGTVADHLAKFAATLQVRGLLADLRLAAYQPQIGRYGLDTTAAEKVAATDSFTALAEITMAIQAGLPGQAIAAASMASLAADLAPDPCTGYRWLVDRLSRDNRKVDQSLRDTALQLADPAGNYAALRHHACGEEVAASWRTRRAALVAYRDRLTHAGGPASVLRTLLHDHHVRGIGVDPEHERITNRLTRAAALRNLAVAARSAS